MKVDLKQHNLEAFEKIEAALARGEKRFAISHCTGSGKSYLIASLCEKFEQEKKVILLPSKYIQEQMQTLFDKYNIINVDFLLYQKLIKMSDEDIAAMDCSLFIFDEYHHDTAKIWGQKIKVLMDTHADSIFFGTSATPVRSDKVNVIDELFDGNCVSNLPLSQAIVKKIVPTPKYVSALYTLDDELERLREKVKSSTNSKEEKDEFYKKINAMRSQIEKSYGMPIILNKYLKVKDGKYLVFCKNKSHLSQIKNTVIEWFKTAGFKDIHAYVVHSSYEKKDEEYEAFCEDTSHSLKLLFCVDMLNEGLHIDDISGVLLLRPTNSNIVWHQQIGRCIEANNTRTPVIIDATNNFQSINQGIGLMQEIKEEILKEKEKNRNFDDSDFLDIDTFFILENVLEVEKLFSEIENRLVGEWFSMFSEYCEFYKEFGHGDVAEGGSKKLVQWCRVQRQNSSNAVLGKDKKMLLNENGFIWDIPRYRFEKNIFLIKKFISENKYYPKQNSQNEEENRLAKFMKAERFNKRKADKEEGGEQPQWKINAINKNKLSDFFNETEKGFDRFVRFLTKYKEKYGHTDIKRKDVIEGYDIGSTLNNLYADYKKEKLTIEQVGTLKNLGIDITQNKYKKAFHKKMLLAQEAIKDGIIINYQNQTWKGINLYTWFFSNKDKFTDSELEIMEKLIPSQCTTIPVRIIDIISNEVKEYPSVSEAARALVHNFHMTDNEKSGINAIHRRLTEKTKNSIYKGRFKFEYVNAA